MWWWITELKKYYPEIAKKGSLKEDEVTDVLKRILKKSISVSFIKYKKLGKRNENYRINRWKIHSLYC